MFIPSHFDSIKGIDEQGLLALPPDEDDFHEYKSSLCKDADLKEKIGRAASGFWNSGGGLFVVGVDDKTGKPDGGIAESVGRESRRDWIDKAVGTVEPRGQYCVEAVGPGGVGLHIKPGHVVVLVAFAPSNVAPHMAPDQKYYIRAGAHTVPARSHIVEGLWARRHHLKPRLVHVATLEAGSTTTSQLYIELAAVTQAPVLDCHVELEPASNGVRDIGKLAATLVDAEHKFGFNIQVSTSGFLARLRITYRDLSGAEYSDLRIITPDSITYHTTRGDGISVQISQTLARIAMSLERRQ